MEPLQSALKYFRTDFEARIPASGPAAIQEPATPEAAEGGG